MKLTYREAKIEDAKIIFDLSNDSNVRLNSINQDKIEWDNHISWFSEKLNDPNYLILLFFDNIEFIGQVKFEQNIDFADISISISNDFRGKGYAVSMLNEAISYLYKKKLRIIKVRALIKVTNNASIKSFINAGFNYKTEMVIKDIRYLVYYLEP